MSDPGLRMRRAIAEGLGTYFLVLIGPGAAMVDAFTGGTIGHAGIALAFGFVVVAMVYALGHLSGAHINPAVTIAFWSVRRFGGGEVLPYVLAQCAGAIGASLTMRAILGPVGNVGATLPAIATSGAFAVEFLLSFVLMLVIMAVATDERVAGGFAGIAVGLTVGFDAMMGGPLTGASMNPARSLGPAVAGGGWDAHWIYWLAPILGMVAAARVYEFLRVAEPLAVVPAGIPLGLQGPIDGDARADGDAAYPDSFEAAVEAPPLACDPDAIAGHERDAHFQLAHDLFRSGLAERRELPDGYLYEFAAEALGSVGRFVENERRCCPFLRFSLDAAPASGAVTLRITGPPGTREFLDAELG